MLEGIMELEDDEDDHAEAVERINEVLLLAPLAVARGVTDAREWLLPSPHHPQAYEIDKQRAANVQDRERERQRAKLQAKLKKRQEVGESGVRGDGRSYALTPCCCCCCCCYSYCNCLLLPPPQALLKRKRKQLMRSMARRARKAALIHRLIRNEASVMRRKLPKMKA